MRGPRPWRVERRELLVEHSLLSVEKQDLSTPSANPPPAEPDRREALVIDAPDWVNVVAVTETGAGGGPGLLMVRQWRFGIAAHTLEIPGGLVDPGESLHLAAVRELEEETGYRAASWHRLGQVEPNPALFNNLCTTYLAEELVQIGDPAGDGDEEIELVVVPIAELGERVSEGEIRHALVIAAFHFYDLYLESER